MFVKSSSYRCTHFSLSPSFPFTSSLPNLPLAEYIYTQNVHTFSLSVSSLPFYLPNICPINRRKTKKKKEKRRKEKEKEKEKRKRKKERKKKRPVFVFPFFTLPFSLFFLLL
ncbi:hypothetical protein L873DRAFT_1813401 [Choiromyces venosus 120613-1]|uniref:Uncharacterized protein n=1 Tax=Choiromyces venosus 120613-1 TaxID=1336337 RepID=A0A3N4JCM7_9PEZI|nr:hypothetical protein L873DRAFT_1813401 [Choiromyces venosus 120613-1]